MFTRRTVRRLRFDASARHSLNVLLKLCCSERALLLDIGANIGNAIIVDRCFEKLSMD
jgi:hypothetical protein